MVMDVRHEQFNAHGNSLIHLSASRICVIATGSPALSEIFASTSLDCVRAMFCNVNISSPSYATFSLLKNPNVSQVTSVQNAVQVLTVSVRYNKVYRDFNSYLSLLWGVIFIC